MARFDGKTVLVTGASKGVGLAAAERFAKLGARVGLVARDRAALEAAAARIGGETHIVAADLAVREECLRTADEVAAALGPIDVLVSAAGTLQRDWVEDVKPDDFDRNWRLHVGRRCGSRSAFCRACASAGRGRWSTWPQSSG